MVNNYINLIVKSTVFKLIKIIVLLSKIIALCGQQFIK